MLIKNRKIMQTCDLMLLTVNKNCFSSVRGEYHNACAWRHFYQVTTINY